jgi:hypothetical protein
LILEFSFLLFAFLCVEEAGYPRGIDYDYDYDYAGLAYKHKIKYKNINR